MGLYNIVIKDPYFYECAVESASITIDKELKIIMIDGIGQKFPYSLSTLEETLLNAGGIATLYERFDRALFRRLVALGAENKRSGKERKAPSSLGNVKAGPTLEW